MRDRNGIAARFDVFVDFTAISFDQWSRVGRCAGFGDAPIDGPSTGPPVAESDADRRSPGGPLASGAGNNAAGATDGAAAGSSPVAVMI